MGTEQVLVGALVVFCILVSVGYCREVLQGRRKAERIDRLEDMLQDSPIERRRGGIPTNVDGPPARVSRARIRQERVRWRP